MKGKTKTSETEGQPPSGSEDGRPPATGTTAGSAEARPPIAIHAQYIKDLSFEAPSTPGIFREPQKQSPNISVNVNVEAKQADGGTYEVTINIEAACKFAETTAFLIELSYGGLFTLNVDAQYVRPLLLIECPRLLFPFARQVIANTTANGGFLPLMLAPVDFAGLYQKDAQQRGAQAAGTPPPSSSES